MKLIQDIKIMRQYRHTRRAVWPYIKLRLGQALSLAFSIVVLSPLLILLLAYWFGRLAEWLNDKAGELPPWSWVRQYNSKLSDRHGQFVSLASLYIRPRRVTG